MRYCAINALSLRRSVGGSRATSGHSVNVTLGLGHVVISSSADDTLRCVPDENGTLGASGHDELLVRCDGDLYKRYTASLSSSNFLSLIVSMTYLCDLAGVADTLVVADALIVVPKLHDLVVT